MFFHSIIVIRQSGKIDHQILKKLIVKQKNRAIMPGFFVLL